MFDDLFLFIRIAQLGSYTKAAKEFGVFQSTLSRRIIKLESSLKVKLIARSSKQFELTKHGQKIFELLSNEEHEIQNKLNTALGCKDAIIGEIKVVLPQSLSLKIITPKLPDFLRTYPQLKVRIFYQSPLVNLKKGGIDLAVTYEMPEHLSQRVKLLHRVSPIAYCAPEYINKYGQVNSLTDICERSHNIICALRDHGEIINKAEIYHREGITEKNTIKINSNIAVNNSMHAMAMVDSGEYIALSYPECIYEHLISGRYVRLLPDYSFAPFNFYLAKRIDDDLRINLFADFIENCFREYTKQVSAQDSVSGFAAARMDDYCYSTPSNIYV